MSTFSIRLLLRQSRSLHLIHMQQQQQQHQLTIHLPFSSKASSKTDNKPTTWERSAKKVKDVDVSNPYLDKMRAEVVDPGLQIKTIEDELCGAIGKALGKQCDKIFLAIRDMNNEYSQYTEHIERNELNKALEYANRHNEARKRAIKARWELLVHRQAVGFTVDNHRIVHDTYPIAAALPDTMDAIQGISCLNNSNNGATDTETIQKDLTKEKFPDQLDWWRTRGRWK